MSCVEVKPFVQEVQEPKLSFDLQKVQQVYDNYVVNYHAGVTMVMGHPFASPEFRKHIRDEQEAIKEVFVHFGIEDLLILYDVDYQVHATLIELASQHDKDKTSQRILNEEETTISSKTKNFMNINYAVDWIKKTSPFEIEIGPDVLSDEHREQTLRITDAGQIVMKGRPKDRKLLAQIRAEFENEAGVIHKYGKDDDEFFFVVGYLKPDLRLHDRQFRTELERCIETRRPHIQMALEVDRIKFIMYESYSLALEACVWESKELRLLNDPELPQNNLADSIIELIRERKLLIAEQEQKAQ